MPKLTETSESQAISGSAAQVVSRVLLTRVRTPIELKPGPEGKVRRGFSCLTSEATPRQFECTKDIARRLYGKAENGSEGLDLLGPEYRFIVGLDKDGVVVRLDVIQFKEPFQGGVRLSGESKDDTTYKFMHDPITGSYQLTNMPRGRAFQEVVRVIEAMDAEEEIRPGQHIGSSKRISVLDIRGNEITLNVPEGA